MLLLLHESTNNKNAKARKKNQNKTGLSRMVRIPQIRPINCGDMAAIFKSILETPRVLITRSVLPMKSVAFQRGYSFS